MSPRVIMKPIVAKPPNIAAMRDEIERSLTGIGVEIQRDFESTVRTWNTKPEFVTVLSVSPKEITIDTNTSSDIYRWVDEGTKPHPIFAGVYTGKSDKQALTVRRSSPKTIPRVIGSNPGVIGPVTALVPYVQHPGTKAREFTKTIRRKWEKKLIRETTKAINRVALASGHRIR